MFHISDNTGFRQTTHQCKHSSKYGAVCKKDDDCGRDCKCKPFGTTKQCQW